MHDRSLRARRPSSRFRRGTAAFPSSAHSGTVGRRNPRPCISASRAFAPTLRPRRPDTGISGARCAERRAHTLRAQPPSSAKSRRPIKRFSTNCLVPGDCSSSADRRFTGTSQSRASLILFDTCSRQPRPMAVRSSQSPARESPEICGPQSRRRSKARLSQICSRPTGTAGLSGPDRGRRRDLRHCRQRRDGRRRREQPENPSASSPLPRALLGRRRCRVADRLRPGQRLFPRDLRFFWGR